MFNPLKGRGNYIATSNNMKLVHWPLMGGLLHLVQRGGDWAGWAERWEEKKIRKSTLQFRPSSKSRDTKTRANIRNPAR